MDRLIAGVYVDDDASEGCRDERGVTSNSKYAKLLLFSERALRVRFRIIGYIPSVRVVADAVVVVDGAAVVDEAAVAIVAAVVSSIFSCALSLWDAPSTKDTNFCPCPCPSPCPSPCIKGFTTCNLLYSSPGDIDNDDLADFPPLVESDNSTSTR